MWCRLTATFCLMFAWLESLFSVTSSLKDVMCHVWRSHVDSTWLTDWSSNSLVCLWRGWRMVRGGQWASRERRMRTRRISHATIPSELWWRTATCCTTSLARPASSLKRAFHRHSYVTQHKPRRHFFFPLVVIHFHPHIVTDLPPPPTPCCPPQQLCHPIQLGSDDPLCWHMLRGVDRSVLWKLLTGLFGAYSKTWWCGGQGEFLRATGPWKLHIHCERQWVHCGLMAGSWTRAKELHRNNKVCCGFPILQIQTVEEV